MNRTSRLTVAGVVLALSLAASSCGTGVRDEKGWNKVLSRDYPCTELLEVAEDLPPSVDRQKVAEDLRQAGCDPPPAFAERG